MSKTPLSGLFRELEKNKKRKEQANKYKTGRPDTGATKRLKNDNTVGFVRENGTQIYGTDYSRPAFEDRKYSRKGLEKAAEDVYMKNVLGEKRKKK